VDALPNVGEFVVWFVVFLFTLTVHEACHGLVAWLGGDSTAYHGGQVTLNPWPHIRREPVGTMVVPLLTFITSGWMMGWASTPYDPEWGRQHPKRLAAMSAAGPAGNLVIAALSFFALKALLASGAVIPPSTINFQRLVEPRAGTPEESILHPLAFLLSVALSLNVLLFLFNLLPLPPLDGAGVLQGLLPERHGKFIEGLRRNPMMSLVGLMIAWQLLDALHRPAFELLYRLLHPGVTYG
jgi:Zn-dependent protease